MSSRSTLRPLRPGRWALSVAAGLAMSGCQGALPASNFTPNAVTAVAPAVAALTAQPGGVVVAGRVISTGGGNWIGTNTGAVISTGGGNVISTGGGNFRVLQAATVVVTLRLDTGRELTTEADAEGRFRFEIVPAAGETLAASGELTLQSNGQQVVVSYPTGATSTTWIRFQAGLLFDLGNVTVDGETTRVEKNPLALVDSDGDGQPDADDLDDDNDGKNDTEDKGSAVYDRENRPAAAANGVANSTEASIKDVANSAGKSPVKDTVKDAIQGAGQVGQTVAGAATGAVTTTVGQATNTVGQTTDTVGQVTETVGNTVGNVVDTVTGGDSQDSNDEDSNDSPVQTVTETVKDTVDKVTGKLPKLGL